MCFFAQDGAAYFLFFFKCSQSNLTDNIICIQYFQLIKCIHCAFFILFFTQDSSGISKCFDVSIIVGKLK